MDRGLYAKISELADWRMRELNIRSLMGMSRQRNAEREERLIRGIRSFANSRIR